MKLATLKNGQRDGQLVVVSRDLRQAVIAQPFTTLQQALENWAHAEPVLSQQYQALNQGQVPEAFAFDPVAAAAPLPRAYQWCDGSAFLNHAHLLQKAFDLAPMKDERIPLMYQGASDDFLGPRDDVPLPEVNHNIDFEGEFAVILDEVPMGCPVEQALQYVRLVLLVNDVSLRGFLLHEVSTGFGFLQAKPSSSFSPVAVTPHALGSAWRNGRVCLPLTVTWNQNWFGSPNGAEMSFSFADLIAHAARTRRLRAGTIIGSGTVSNLDCAAGSACISERRAIEMIEHGKPLTGFMNFGDRIRIEALDGDDQSVFGAIDQRVVEASS
ncbi:fumarylacetoacetate hydrolase family protein [Pseudomonas sp. BIGb0164]|jgi:fumarylacetoacetate (FAA) hydrolase|uniref:fumarylacetoacetate hydrolase family protein n=1 Tax=Pseudomonas sp. BIGb0164 TaxID=2940605 RepID=UPI000ECC5C6E|nr:fumarylacetoacetate hydrolase family protein [Pseudomonas sp. BIGb0164]MCS4249405.1 fumarylacetoacetate (FAA) hydrolase [Pseudomonas sp. BIGb0164]HCT07203.1 fumarylacetoacetate hydrolase [Pseudomonas sp.]